MREKDIVFPNSLKKAAESLYRKWSSRKIEGEFNDEITFLIAIALGFWHVRNLKSSRKDFLSPLTFHYKAIAPTADKRDLGNKCLF